MSERVQDGPIVDLAPRFILYVSHGLIPNLDIGARAGIYLISADRGLKN